MRVCNITKPGLYGACNKSQFYKATDPEKIFVTIGKIHHKPASMCYFVVMPKVFATEKIQPMHEGFHDCSCPIISGDKACSIVALINEFVSDTNPILCEFQTEQEFSQFVIYCALASLGGAK